MKLKILSVALECKDGNVSYQFNRHITVIYGNVGVGKTSLLNLVSYCLGNDIVKTPAIDSQVISVSLTISVNENIIILKRQIGSNFINAKTADKELSLKAKDTSSVNTITNYFYHLARLRPAFVIPKNQWYKEKEIKITFSNYFWFSYLRQDEIDNSLFYFGESQSFFKEVASQSVFFELLGGNSHSDSELQSQIRRYTSLLAETKRKVSIGDEIRKKTSLLNINTSEEITKKQKILIELRTLLDSMIQATQVTVDREQLTEMLSIQYKIGLFEAEIKYLSSLGKVKSVLDDYHREKENYENILVHMKERKGKAISDNASFRLNLDTISDVLLETFISIRFPGIEIGDSIRILQKDFIPRIFSYDGKEKFSFHNLSSGGKKTIFKLCYAIAIHRTILKNDLVSLVPSVLIVDTPMKNISEREDLALYNNLFSLLGKTFSDGGVLSETQLIIVDKELHPYLDTPEVTKYHLSHEEPLLPYNGS